METLKGTIAHAIYSSPDNGYVVLCVKNSRFIAGCTVVGTFFDAGKGVEIEASGEWIRDPKYGRQFKAESIQQVYPTDVTGIENYLGSGLIKGVGKKLAHEIVRKFGVKAIEVIENEPDRLREVPGVGRGKICKILESWGKNRHIKNIMMFLQNYGISTAYALKIYHRYEKDAVRVVKENPYVLSDNIKGIGFHVADEIAKKMGFSQNSPMRIRSGLLFTLSQEMSNGHIYMDEELLLSSAMELLGIDDEIRVSNVFRSMVNNDVIVCEGRVYLPMYYNSEVGIARKIHGLMQSKQTFLPLVESNIKKIKAITKIEYNAEQLKAIETSLNNKVMVLTGGPGTGKTTTVQGILAMHRLRGHKIRLAAPTGRAAKRLSEAAGCEAKTIHRLLEFNPESGYARNESNPLTGDVLVVDECSMIDTLLMYTLLKAVPSDMSVILVGDIDQLPSIGAGNVLRDIIASGVVPVIELKEIFRQALSSRIVTNAHAINHGCFPDITNANGTDFFFIECPEKEQVFDNIVELVARRLPKAYGGCFNDIQVLTPMVKGDLGTVALNNALQEAINPGGEGVSYGNYIYRTGDKVMQTSNDYKKGVFNGDSGVVLGVDREERSVTVDFGEKTVVYEASDLDSLMLSYAATIHKSQGSEYPIVVMPVHMAHYVMLQRNLLYTGITRSKKICVLVGTKQALSCCVSRHEVLSRRTMLAERLRNIG